MKRAVALLALCAGAAGAQNVPAPTELFDPTTLPPVAVGTLHGSYAKCLLDELPGTMSDIVAENLLVKCLRAYPYGFNTIEAGSTWFGYRTAAECTIRNAKDTASRRAAQLIAMACAHRYPA